MAFLLALMVTFGSVQGGWLGGEWQVNLGLTAQLAPAGAPPFPAAESVQGNDPAPQEDGKTGQTSASGIVDGAKDGSRLMRGSLRNRWRTLLSGNSPIYSALVPICGFVSTVIVAFWGIGMWTEMAGTSGYLSTKMIGEVAFVGVAIIVFAGGGLLLPNIASLFEGGFNYVNEAILTGTQEQISYYEAIRQVKLDDSSRVVIANKMEECARLPIEKTDEQGNTINPRQNCEQQVMKEARQLSTDLFPQKSGGGNPVTDSLVGFLRAGMQTFIWIILSGMAAGFQWLLQMSFFLNAHIGIVFLTTSLLWSSGKPIYAWLSGFMAFGVTMIMYTIIVGITASAIVDSQHNEPLFLPLIEAVFSPLLAGAMGLTAGAATYTALLQGGMAVSRGIGGGRR